MVFVCLSGFLKLTLLFWVYRSIINRICTGNSSIFLDYLQITILEIASIWMYFSVIIRILKSSLFRRWLAAYWPYWGVLILQKYRQENIRPCLNCTVNMTLSSLLSFFMSWIIQKIRQKNTSSPIGLFTRAARDCQGKSKKYFKVNTGRGFAEAFCLDKKGFILK